MLIKISNSLLYVCSITQISFSCLLNIIFHPKKLLILHHTWTCYHTNFPNFIFSLQKLLFLSVNFIRGKKFNHVFLLKKEKNCQVRPEYFLINFPTFPEFRELVIRIESNSRNQYPSPTKTQFHLSCCCQFSVIKSS